MAYNENPTVVTAAAPCAVSWSSIVAGSLAAAALSLIMLLLGSGIGLGVVSPWSRTGISASTFTVLSAVWLMLTAFVASGFGGYLAGRLRAKWTNVHGDEAYFRDTAHGLLSWALSTVLTAALLTSVITTVVSGGAQAGAVTMASGAAGAGYAMHRPMSGPDMANPDPYVIDTLFRSDAPANADARDTRGEVTMILARGVKDGALSDSDKAYLTKVVSARTGVSPDEASARVDNTMAQLNDAKQKAKEMADKARKATMKATLYTFLSLLIGAFIASYAALCGGRRRDTY